ncbi:uncharacterized protein K02A2.6-like [Momordica charantia]|uniref:Uncharacterized protein K02A2.6-like n=1 Tax=Momordica charantia TaxID=3673 RepID=A0A6J1DSK1_MOMCH|nr:uncharacterized protein K02A2.6-like [Momordica charantia]
MLTLISSPWPFAQWGLDLIDPLPKAKWQLKYVVVAVDYFTKWVKAEPLASITEDKVVSFVWKNIVCRFSIPYALITDNGKQFDSARFNRFYQQLGIRHFSLSPTHPKSNGQVEAINKINKRGLKTKLESLKGRWAESCQKCCGPTELCRAARRRTA